MSVSAGIGAVPIALLGVHIAAAVAATGAGGASFLARKGGPLHVRAGRIFVPAMFSMYGFGVVYAAFDPTPDPILTVAAVIGAYLVATAWRTAKRRDGTAGRFEHAAFAVILACLALSLAFLYLASTSPDGRFFRHGPATIMPNIIISSLAASFDLAFILRGRLTANQRIARHVWRVSVAMLMVTFSTFAGDQAQKVFPDAIRGSFFLVLPAIAVLLAMVYWLVRLRFGRGMRRRAQKPDRNAATLAPRRSTA
jgi:hypothetical protein